MNAPSTSKKAYVEDADDDNDIQVITPLFSAPGTVQSELENQGMILLHCIGVYLTFSSKIAKEEPSYLFHEIELQMS